MNQLMRALAYEGAFEDFLTTASPWTHDMPREAVRQIFMNFCRDRFYEKDIPNSKGPLIMYALLATETPCLN